MYRMERGMAGRIAGVIMVVLVLATLGIVNGSGTLRAESGATFTTTLGHFAAFSDSLERSQVVVQIDGQQAAAELAYLQQVQNLTLDTGTHEIVVDPQEWSGGAITQTFELPVPGTIGLNNPGAVLAINGGTSGVPLNVLVQMIEQSTPSQGVLIRLTNLALFAVGGESEYTLCNADGSPFYNVDMVRYGESSEYVVIPGGLYPVYLAGSYGGCGARLTPDLLLMLEDKSVANLYAVGSNASSVFPDTLTVVSTSAVVLRPEVYLPTVVN